LFEALNWAVALDERTAKTWAPDGVEQMPGWEWRKRIEGGRILLGVRWVRNAMHHDWAEVLHLAQGGERHLEKLPSARSAWVWRQRDEIPRGKPDKHRGETIYQEEMEDRLVRSTLVGLNSGFGQLRDLLEPGSIRERLEEA
jgi:hypothetical protein